jgi:hypothetical protein
LQAEIKAEMQKRLAQRFGQISSKENGTNSTNATKTTPLIRFRVVDLLQNGDVENMSENEIQFGTLTLWRPEKELVEHLSENSRFRIFGLIANSIRDKDVQFRTTKQTKFIKEDEKKITPSSKDISEFRRNFTDIGDIISFNNFCPKFHEVDLVGIVITARDKSSKTSPGPNFETVYICDTMFNFAAIHFWGGFSECGYEKSMFFPQLCDVTPKRSTTPKIVEQKPNVLIFKNLQWRPSSSRGGFFGQNNRRVVISQH